MKLHVHDENSPLRSASEVRAMAVAVQANLFQLIVAESRRKGVASGEHEIKALPPGHVRDFRETLIDRTMIAGYSDLELHLRLREIWGRFCLMSWLFSLNDGDRPVNFGALPPGVEMHCSTALEIKRAEVNAFLWKMLFEQRNRTDPAFAASPPTAEHSLLAERIPAFAFGRPVAQLTDDELLFASCEHAGMLGTIRWVLDKSREWDDPRLMSVDESDFDT